MVETISILQKHPLIAILRGITPAEITATAEVLSGWRSDYRSAAQFA